MTKKKGFNIESLRNLPQYRDLTDEEFQEKVDQLLQEETEKLAQEYFERFEDDYVLDELKANDRVSVEILSYLYAQVRINQDKYTRLQQEDNPNIQKALSIIVQDNEKLIRSIALLENQLAIARTSRLKEEGTDLVSLVQTVKEKAESFLEGKLHYIFCPKCRMLLANVWVLYKDVEGAYELKLICKREMKDKICNTEVVIIPGDLNEYTSKAIQTRDGPI